MSNNAVVDECLELTLPHPPTLNTYWRRVGNRTLLSAKGRRYKEDVRVRLIIGRVRPLAGLLGVEIDWYPPDRRRRDIDNILKALFDSLGKGGAYEDDSQIVRLTIAKFPPVVGGKVVVRLRKV